MNTVNLMASATLTGACLDVTAENSGPDSSQDTDISYWTGLCESYQPEWFPLGANLTTRS